MSEIDQQSSAASAGFSPFWRITLPLALAEIIVWAAYYYAFPALLLIWEKDLGWSKTELSLAFTLALIASATLAPVVGRQIDRGRAALVFAGSALFAAGMLAALSAVTALWQFYLVWIGLGAAMAGSLYEACFSVVTRALGPAARRGIAHIALIAGFAGTVSFPSAHLLSAWLGWRGAVLVFSAAVAFIAVPLILFACSAGERHRSKGEPEASPDLRLALGVIGDVAFWRIAFLFIAVAVNHGVLLTHLLPLLSERGVAAETAVLAAAMIGPMQVAGRVAMVTIGRNASSRAIFIACLVSTALAALLLLGAGASPIFLIGFVALQGAGYGVTSVVRPVFVAEQFGRENFGTVAGLLAIAFIGGSAASPTIAALIWTLGGYGPVIGFALAASALGLLTLKTTRGRSAA
ncbi:MAG: MFS transporter [Alphaproteobacteria bacterium]|nr:MFS transporter [Alphaproteobacteria bacterium]